MKFLLEVELGSSGLETSLDLSNLLAKVAMRLAHGHYDLTQEMDKGVMDCNGNSCGSWHLISTEVQIIKKDEDGS
jgi:hypothetical protein